MPVIFPYEYSQILRHSSDDSTLDIKVCPRNLFWLTVSPNSISLYYCKDNKFLARYLLTNEQNQKFGFFTQATWVSNTQFAVLFNAGFIFLFSLAESFIKLENIFDSNQSSTRLSLSSFSDYVVCGDDNGCITFLSTDMKKNEEITIQVADFPIKQIIFNDYHTNNINGNYAIILSAEGSSFYFPIDISMLHTPNYHFTMKCLSQIQSSSICISRKNISAVFEMNNNIFVTDVSKPDTADSKQNSFRFKARSASRGIVSFADDLTLFVVYNNGFITLWNFVIRVQHTFKFPDLQNSNCMAISNSYAYLSNETGIFVIPLFSLCYSEFPLLKGPNSVIEFRPIKNGAIPVKYDLSAFNESVVSVTADDSEMYVAVALETKIILITRSNSSLIQEEKLHLIPKFVQFHGKFLSIVEFDSFHYFLKFVSINNNYEIVSTYELPTSPSGMSADNNGCVVYFSRRLSIFENFKFLQNVELESSPIHCCICSNAKKVIVLLQSCVLQLVDYNDEVIRISTISEEVSDFFYDNNFSMIFVMKGIRVKFCSLANLKLVPFCECADTAIGIISSCSAILFLTTNKFNPTINYFFDYSIVSEMQNPDAAANTMLPMRKANFFPNLIRQISVFALREKMGKNLVIFLSHFPEQFKFCLSSALRSVESPERQGVFESLGSASEIFANFAGLSINSTRSGIIMFNEKADVPESDSKNASILLPVVMEEEGPNIAFPATFYILKKFHYEIEYIESLFRFLDPLVSPPEMLEDGKVSAVGMIMTVKDYTELKRRLSETIEFCLIDLLLKFKPHLIIPFAFSAQVPIDHFFKKHRSMDLKSNLVTVMDKVAPLLTEGKATKQDLKTFADEALRFQWEVWPVALFILAGETKKARQILNQHHELKDVLSKSQWVNLL
ncbi:hypothetical protein M9Y10_043413 [Tritrichomonas musculus]|uniref:Nucleoporin Nup133/Nup155-like N-terminal domain-containing protein n=1 Tax=Tritrichomonas musculus TaxID=1915356 RepID=A0ABR2JZL9_9EUKA